MMWMYLLAILVIDLPYLHLSSDMYRKVMPLDGNFVLGGSIAYFSMALALSRFATSAKSAALLFATIYGTFNGTVLATHGRYTLDVAVKDTLWGALLGYASYTLVEKFKARRK